MELGIRVKSIENTDVLTVLMFFFSQIDVYIMVENNLKSMFRKEFLLYGLSMWLDRRFSRFFIVCQIDD